MKRIVTNWHGKVGMVMSQRLIWFHWAAVSVKNYMVVLNYVVQVYKKKVYASVVKVVDYLLELVPVAF